MPRTFSKWLKRIAGTLGSVTALLLLVACTQHFRLSEDTPLPAPQENSLRLATLNVHYIILGKQTGAWSVGDWEDRRQSLDQAFKHLNPDLMAFQEMESFQRGNDGDINLARDWLVDRNPDYAVAATGPWQDFPPTQPIFYRTDRLRQDDQGWFFFSDTPDVIYSRTFNGSYPAFASWARFTDRATGQGFYVINVHFEYNSGSNRRLSAALVRDRITPWIAANEPVILLGDLNALAGSETMTILEQAGLAFPDVPGATYHFNSGINLFGAIDHIGLFRAQIDSGPFTLQQQFDGRWPTDHYPVVADVQITP